MSNTNKKVYVLEIQGTKESYDAIVNINDVLASMDEHIQSVNKQEQELNKTKKQSKQATDELTKVQEKLNQYDAEYQRELAKAKAALQEKNKAIQEEVKAEKLAEGSYYAKQAALSKLGKEIKSYVANTDEEKQQLEEMKAQYASLNDELKDFDKTMGNHQREVGNYAIATQGLKEELKNLEDEMTSLLANGISTTDEGFQQLAHRAGEIKAAMDDAKKEIAAFSDGSKKINDVVNIAQSLTAGFGLLQSATAAFGIENEEVNESIQKMMAAMTALQSLQQISSSLTDETSASYKILNKALQLFGLQKKQNTVALQQDTTAQTVNATATGAATVATSASTTALKAFKIALASTGVGLLVIALGYLIANFDEIKSKVVEFLPFLGEMGESFENLKSVLAGVGEAVVNYLLTPIKTVIAVVKGFMEDGIKGAVKAGTNEFKKGINVIDNYKKGYDKQEAKNQQNRIKENAKSLDKELNDKIKNLEAQKGRDFKFSKDGIEIYKQFYANKKKLYDKDSDDYKNAVNEEIAFLREVTEHEQAELKKRQDAWKAAADKRKADLEKLKEDTKKILEDTTKLYLDNEQVRLDAQRKGIEDLNVYNQEQLNYKLQQLSDINKKQEELIQKNLDKELELVKEQYDKLIKEAEKLNQDTTQLTDDYNKRKQGLQDKADAERLSREKELNKQIIQEQDKLNKYQIDQSQKTVDEINKTLDNQLKNIKTMNTKTSKTGGFFNVIDVEKTKKDIEDAKQAYDDLAISLLEQSKVVAQEYDRQLALTAQTYGSDSKEYQDLLNKKTLALDKYLSDYKVANQASMDLQKQEADLMNEYWDSVSQQIGERFKLLNEAILTPLYDAFTALNDMQLEQAQKNLEKVQKLHDKAVQEVTDSQSRIEDLNNSITASNGLRRDELEKTLADEVLMLKQREAEEQRLAIETQKAEEEVAEKERAQRKMDAGKKIIEGAINTAIAVTAALPNLVLAGIVGAMGAASTAIAAAQYAKLEDGGLLSGKSHKQGGMKIQGSNIEVEGGEYVVNKRSTQQFLPLLERINEFGKNKSSSITYNNIYHKYENGGQLDYELINSNLNQNNPYNKMMDKFNDVTNQPIFVSVTDINRGQNRVAKVKDMAGATY